MAPQGRTVLSEHPNFLSVEAKTVNSTEARKGKSRFHSVIELLSARFLLGSSENIREY